MNLRHLLPLLLLPIAATAGEEKDALPEIKQEPSNAGNWCEWLSNEPGLIYQDKKNPWIDKFEISGRLHYQMGRVRGDDVRGNSFDETFDEYRRARIETKIGFLDYFDLEVGVNLVDDRRFRTDPDDDLDWGYDTFDSAILSFNIGKAFGRGPFDDIRLHYGRMKLNVTEEVHTSSNKIMTVERSMLADKLGGAQTRPTGATLELAKGDWTGFIGVFSGEDDSEFIGGWNDGQAYYATIAYQYSDNLRFGLDLVQNDTSGADDFLGYDWAAAFNTVYEQDRFGLLTTLIAGENNDPAANRGGSFHGLVVMPWYWIVEDRLQAVFQYQYAGSSESQGVRMNSRYVRAANTAAINAGRGDELHTLYAGLNYHLCGDNAKIMAGVEYSTLDTPVGDVDAVTYLVAFRTFF
jgi:hypothetical protein